MMTRLREVLSRPGWLSRPDDTRMARLPAPLRRLLPAFLLGQLLLQAAFFGFYSLPRADQALYGLAAVALIALLIWAMLHLALSRLESARLALQQSEASYRAIFNAAEDAIFVHDMGSGAIVDANPRACQNFGYDLAELRRMPVSSLGSGQPPYAQIEVEAVLARAAAGQAQRLEWRSRHRDGRLRWDEIYVKRATIGGVERILAIARDISEKKAADEQLARQREVLHEQEKLAALGSLLAGVAHELNNPLSVVVARSIILEEAAGAETRLAAGRIRAAAERCVRIVRTFLAMARQQQPEPGPVVLDSLLAEVLELVAFPLRNAGIAVRVDGAAAVPTVRADSAQLHQVMMNLILNAQQALAGQSGPREIEIRCRHDRRGGTVSIDVADNGPGVPPALRSRIFEPYFTTKARGAGTGVGLAVSLGMVEANGGRLRLKGGDGAGACFVVELPVFKPGTGGGQAHGDRAQAGSDASPDQGPAVPDTAGRQLRVLIVEGDAGVRQALMAVVEGEGHVALVASTPAQVVDVLAHTGIDAVFLDDELAGPDGQPLRQVIDKRWPDLQGRCVLVGEGLEARGGDGLSTGPGCLGKPFLPSEVRGCLAGITALSSDRCEEAEGGRRQNQSIRASSPQ